MIIKLPKMSFSSLRGILFGLIFTSIVFSSGYYFGTKGLKVSIKNNSPQITVDRTQPEVNQNVDFALFWKVWDTLQGKYFDKSKLVQSKMVYGAIGGMVSALGDPYTVFLAPSENKVVEEDLKGNFEGVGIQIGFKGTQLVVIAPLPKSPGEKAGILPGDYILEIKDAKKNLDITTNGISVSEAVEAIRGESGTTVTLTLLREGSDKPFTVDVNREKIDVPSVIINFVGEKKNIAHIQVVKFADETLTEWNDAVAEVLKNPEVMGIIVDVRNNPGGYLQRAVDLSGDFLDNGSVVVREENGDGSKEEYTTKGLPRLKNYKMLVLMNGGSASASEIFAGAMRDQRKAQLVGTKSFGKGTIQEPEQLTNGAGLHITIAKWLTPNGTWVHEKGLEPDVKVENEPNSADDKQLQQAIQVILSQP
jgi:carboxyl-terminal processing protease